MCYDVDAKFTIIRIISHSQRCVPRVVKREHRERIKKYIYVGTRCRLLSVGGETGSPKKLLLLLVNWSLRYLVIVHITFLIKREERRDRDREAKEGERSKAKED